jgi:Flp pilus assembly protein protease CpaA
MLTIPTKTDLRQRYRSLYRIHAPYKLALGLLAPLPLFAVLPFTLALTVWVLLTATATDLLWRRIFNWVLAPVFLTTVVFHASHVSQLLDISQHTGLTFGFMLALYLVFRGGEGDVKLVTVLGALLGSYPAIEAAMFGYLFAAMVAVGLYAAAWVKGRKPAIQTLPMAPFFTLGVIAIHTL